MNKECKKDFLMAFKEKLFDLIKIFSYFP